MWYFAYGANTHLTDMAQRCPAATLVGRAKLNGHAFRYRGGLAHAEISPGEVVWGMLWRITPTCLAQLDAFEAAPLLYTRRLLAVKPEEGEVVAAVVYQLALPGPYLPPHAEYHQIILSGYRQCGLAADPVVDAYRQCRPTASARLGAQDLHRASQLRLTS